jgi:excisionase family DNA binding protein
VATEWLSIGAAAARVGVSIPTIRRALKAGTLPGFSLGQRLVRIRAADLDAWAARTPYCEQQGHV